MRVEAYQPEYLDQVVELSVRAWAPVFESIEATLPPNLYQAFYGDGWEASQRADVSSVCTSDAMKVWVALDGDIVAGFVALKLNAEEKLGEIYMIATDPAFQGKGAGMLLTEFALERMREAGMEMALVETGLDPGHGPARRLYERAGFGLWPAARYFKKL